MPTPLDVSNLEALLESAQLLHGTLELDDLLRHLLRTAMGRLVVGRGLVAVEEHDTMVVALARGARGIKAGEPFDEARARAAGLAHFVPIGDRTAPVGVLGVAPPPHGTFSPEELAFLDALSGLAASGIANARAHREVRRLNVRLDQKIQELRTLLELVRALTGADGPEEVARLLGLTLAGQWATSRWAVFAVRAGHPPVALQKGTTHVWDPECLAELAAMDDAVRLDDGCAGTLPACLRGQKLALLFPLRNPAGVFGFAAVGARPGNRPYTDADCEFGTGVVAQAIVAFENAWHQREVLERKQFERELSLAASIQKSLFPAELPAIPGYALAAMNRPARLVGGDYYDALVIDISRPESGCLFCVADVSGKGVAASLLMSNIQATLRALLGREASLAELARCINELLYTSTPGNKYATAVFLGVDPLTGESRYVSAGHTEALVLKREGDPLRFGATGLALGLFPGIAYEEDRFVLEPGDLAVLYSDGINEAQNAQEEEFGTERLIASLQGRAGAPAEQVLAGVIEDLDAFVGDAPQHDDITLLVVKRER